MQRVVYNSKFGGFGVHDDAVMWVRENKDALSDEYTETDIMEFVNATIAGEYYSDGSGPKHQYRNYTSDISRDNELLADVVTNETDYDGQINGSHANLSVAEVPDGVEWEIDEYDGNETVREKAETFR